MKNLNYLYMVLVAFAMGCKDGNKLTVEGTFENAGTENKVYLHMASGNSIQVIDSTVLSDKGAFKFSKEVPEVNFFKVSIGDRDYFLIGKNGDEIKIKADVSDADQQYTLSGAEDAERLMAFNKLKKGFTTRLDSLEREFERQVEAQPEQQADIRDRLSPVYMSMIDQFNKDVVGFALDNTHSLVSFYAINSINPRGYEASLVEYVGKLGEDIKKNKLVADFAKRIEKLKNLMVGQPAPDFTLAGIDGTPVRLADYKGKYVLLDFWASWCAPCRHENPNLVKAYHQFKNRNFTILGISLDKDKAAWKQAIAQDQLVWDQAGELADFEGPTVRLYQVEAIPSSYLIGPDGKIVAKDLRGEQLGAFLDKTLPK